MRKKIRKSAQLPTGILQVGTGAGGSIGVSREAEGIVEVARVPSAETGPRLEMVRRLRASLQSTSGKWLRRRRQIDHSRLA